MEIRKVSAAESVGLPLSHDLTQIDPVKHYKGPRFRKGYIIRKEDLVILKRMGREYLNIIILQEGEVHEDNAASRLGSSMLGPGVFLEGPSEGKCIIKAAHKGILTFNPERVLMINRVGEWIISTLNPYERVEKDQPLAGFRVLPLAVHEETVLRAIDVACSFEVIPFRDFHVGLVTVGNELAESIINDAFRPVLEKKLYSLGGSLKNQLIVHDREYEIVKAIEDFYRSGCDIILCSGGMSVDADDRTPFAIRSCCDEVLFQGIPVLPGSMLMLARKGNCFLIGVPACVVHNERTSLDPVLERLFAGLVPDSSTVASWGVGGLCRNCEICNYPHCSFSVRP